MPVTIKCVQCGALRVRSPARAARASEHFCSRQCRGVYVRNRVSVACDHCGAMFSLSPSRVLAHNFCDPDCYFKWQRDRIFVPCDQCGKQLERTRQWAERSRNFCDLDCKAKSTTANLAGPNSAHWRGGTIRYYGPNWHAQRRAARKRDGYKCQHCGMSQKRNGSALDVHHIRPFREFGYVVGENENHLQANDLSNLITLCRTCHRAAECGDIPVQPRLFSRVGGD